MLRRFRTLTPCLRPLSPARVVFSQGDHNYIKGNTKFFAVPYRGVGSLAVIPYTQMGKQKPSFPMIVGHKGKVLDFDFNPFHEHIIASTSEDCTVKVWGIPEPVECNSVFFIRDGAPSKHV